MQRECPGVPGLRHKGKKKFTSWAAAQCAGRPVGTSDLDKTMRRAWIGQA
jgi:hypothetical protein